MCFDWQRKTEAKLETPASLPLRAGGQNPDLYSYYTKCKHSSAFHKWNLIATHLATPVGLKVRPELWNDNFVFFALSDTKVSLAAKVQPYDSDAKNSLCTETSHIRI